MSFNDWKRTLRIRRAENMLINTSKTVNEISLSLGYENTETFIRLFRKELHVTPGEYRRIISRHVDKNGVSGVKFLSLRSAIAQSAARMTVNH